MLSYQNYNHLKISIILSLFSNSSSSIKTNPLLYITSISKSSNDGIFTFPLSCANFKFETVSSPVWFKSYLYTLIVESPILNTFPSLAPIISELVLSDSSSILISASSNFFLNSPI